MEGEHAGQSNGSEYSVSQLPPLDEARRALNADTSTSGIRRYS